MLAVLALFLVGGEVLRGLSFVLLFGIIIGTYSTIYVASAMVLFWEGREAAKDGAKAGGAQGHGDRRRPPPDPRPRRGARRSSRRPGDQPPL